MKTTIHPALMFHTAGECLSILREVTKELREEGEKVEACAHLMFFNTIFGKQNENRNTPTQDMEHDKRQVDGITR